MVKRPRPITKIKFLRIEARLSQNQLAQMADLDRTTVLRAEHGELVNDMTLSKLATALTRALGRDILMEDLQR